MVVKIRCYICPLMGVQFPMTGWRARFLAAWQRQDLAAARQALAGADQLQGVDRCQALGWRAVIEMIMDRGNYAACRRDIQAALAAAARNPVARAEVLLNAMAVSYYASIPAEVQSAYAELERLWAKYPDDPDVQRWCGRVYYILARTMEQMNRLEDALRLFARAEEYLSTCPHPDEAASAACHIGYVRLFRGHVLLELGDQRGAAREIESAAPLLPPNRLRARLLVERGELALACGDVRSAHELGARVATLLADPYQEHWEETRVLAHLLLASCARLLGNGGAWRAQLDQAFDTAVRTHTSWLIKRCQLFVAQAG